MTERSTQQEWESWRERVAYWWAYRLHDLRCLTCRWIGHDWCGWDELPDLHPGSPGMYRVCDRCCELEERSDPAGAP